MEYAHKLNRACSFKNNEENHTFFRRFNITYIKKILLPEISPMIAKNIITIFLPKLDILEIKFKEVATPIGQPILEHVIKRSPANEILNKSPVFDRKLIKILHVSQNMRYTIIAKKVWGLFNSHLTLIDTISENSYVIYHEMHLLRNVCTTSDSKHLIYDSNETGFCIFSIRKLTVKRKIKTQSNRGCVPIITPDKSKIIVACNKNLHIYDFKTGDFISSVKCAQHTILCIKIKTDDILLVLAERSIMALDLNSLQVKHFLKHMTEDVTCFDFSVNTTKLLLGTSEGKLIKWNYNYEEMKVFQKIHESCINFICYFSDSKYFVTNDENLLCIIWNSKKQEPISIFSSFLDQVSVSVINPKENYALVGFNSGRIHCWSLEPLFLKISTVRHNFRVNAFTFCHVTKYIFTGSDDMKSFIIRREDFSYYKTLEFDSEILSLATTSNNSYLILGALNCKFYIITINQLEEIKDDKLQIKDENRFFTRKQRLLLMFKRRTRIR